MQFLNEKALDSAIAARLESRRKALLLGVTGSDGALQVDDLGVMSAKGDVTLASNMSNQVYDTPVSVWSSLSTPFSNLIGAGRPIALPKQTYKVSLKTVNLLERRAKRGGYAEEGKRVGSSPINVVDSDFVFSTRGAEASATAESLASAGLMGDPLALGIKIAMADLRDINEFAYLFGAGTGSGLGTTPTPTVTPAATGGTLPSGAYVVHCVAMSAGAAAEYKATGTLPVTYSRPNKGSATNTTVPSGLARKSVASSSVTIGAGDAGTLTCSVAAVRGAFSYAWFTGLSGAVRLHAVTTINSVVIATPAASDALAIAALPAADESFDPLAFNGQFAQLLNPASGSYIKQLPTGVAGVGTALTRSGMRNSVTQVDDVLSYLFEAFGVTPQVLMMSSKTFRAVAALIRPDSLLQPIYGDIQMDYPNNTGSGVRVRMVIGLDMPDGVVYFHSTSIPLSPDASGSTIETRVIIPASVENWSKINRAQEVGVYMTDTLVCCIPPAFALLTNIAV